MKNERKRKGGAAAPDPAGEAPEQTFEESMARLESVVQELERGETGLEESLRLFEEGVAIARKLETRLADAEMKVEQLLRAADGSETVEPLETEET